MRKTICLVILLGIAGCASHEVTEQISIAGGHTVACKQVRNQFVNAENDRFVVTEAGLTTYRTEGKNFVRWTFAIRPKESTQLASVEVADVTGRRPLILLRDEHPQIEELQWTQQSGLIRANPAVIPWLFNPDDTTHVFRIAVTTIDGQRSILYQATRYNEETKRKFRVLMGPELQPPTQG